MMKEEDGVVTHHPNRYYESTPGSGSTKYYFADGQLVTLERSPEYGDAYGRRFVFRDHLGSTSIIVNGQGVGLWEDRYLPFGDVRYHSDTVTNTVQTRYRFTGQWLEEGLAASPENGPDRGLYDYGARWYDASLGRFVQPDTIVPEPGNPQSLNRYTYGANNPIRYADPSGHCIVQYSGDVRMNEGPYGTSGLCANTESVIVEGNAAIEEYHNDPNIATSIEELLFWYIGGPAILLGGVDLAAALPVVIEISEPIASAACADRDCSNEIKAIETGTHTVYRYVENGVVRYIGITNNFERRAWEHLLQKEWVIQRIPGLSQLSPFDARSVEQTLIENYGLGKNGGILLNKINSIAATNPIYAEAVRRGQTILETIQFHNLR